MKTAFLFPGQGAQVVGMGKDVADAFPTAAQIFEKANDLVGFDLRGICFDGPADKLNTTAISQPAIFVTSAAILEAVRTTAHGRELVPDVTAGLSLGEYTALYAAGLLSFEETLILVKKRGQAMQAAADERQGGMVSIIGLDAETVRKLCAEARGGELLEPANFNCQGQIVVSGTTSACDRTVQLAEKYGAVKAVRLEVAGAFHTEMMAAAAQALRTHLMSCHIAEPGHTRVIANTDAEYYQNSKKIVDGLIKQLTCPVLWQQCMQRLVAEGVECFYEIGPGRVLTGLMKRIDRKAKVVNINSLGSVNEFAAC
jgi:[acyl-carrier-protein] S-malonyltransferase